MDLKQLGLSEYEEKAYIVLVKLGKSGASSISRESGVSYGKIYEVLASLERKGLVKVVPEKTKMFVATDPKNLMKLVQKKERELKSLKERIKDLKQAYETHEKEVVQMVKGKRNFYKLVREQPKSEKFAYAVKSISEFNPEFVRSIERLLKKGINVKSLTRYDKESESNVKKWLKIYPNIREIKNNGVALSINESSVMISLIRNNVSMLIKDEAFSNVMRILFEGAYKNAERIKK